MKWMNDSINYKYRIKQYLYCFYLFFSRLFLLLHFCHHCLFSYKTDLLFALVFFYECGLTMMIMMIANFFFQRAVNVDILPSRSKSKKKTRIRTSRKNLIKEKVKANRPNWVSVEWFLLKKNFLLFFFEITFFLMVDQWLEKKRMNIYILLKYILYKDMNYKNIFKMD